MTDRTDIHENDVPAGDEAILERNVEQLLTRAHEPPRMSEAARKRVLTSLKERARASAAAGQEHLPLPAPLVRPKI